MQTGNNLKHCFHDFLLAVIIAIQSCRHLMKYFLCAIKMVSMPVDITFQIHLQNSYRYDLMGRTTARDARGRKVEQRRG